MRLAGPCVRRWSSIERRSPPQTYSSEYGRLLGTPGRAWWTLPHALAETLPRHLQKAEMADMADLNARPVVAQAFFELALYGAVVAPLVHVDVVDNDQSRQVPQAHLPGHFL